MVQDLFEEVAIEDFPASWLGPTIAAYFLVGIVFAPFVYRDARRVGVSPVNSVVTTLVLWPVMLPLHYFFLRRNPDRWRAMQNNSRSDDNSSSFD